MGSDCDGSLVGESVGLSGEESRGRAGREGEEDERLLMVVMKWP